MTLPSIITLHMEDLKNEKHTSVLSNTEMYSLLIVRLPEIYSLYDLKTVSNGFILSKDECFFFNRDSKTFESFLNKYESLYVFLDQKIDALIRGLEEYEETISLMEENIDKKQEDFMTNWMLSKKDLLRVERVMLRTTNVMRSFINLEKNKEGFDINKFMDILEHCDRVHRQTTTQLSRLEYLYNFYTSKNTERMNKLMSILTLVSVIFLPLNLIVGYFGMNTSGLPLTVSTTMGSTIVAWLLLSTSAFVGIITYFVLRLFQK